MTDTLRRDPEQGGEGGRAPHKRVISERVARAAARTLLAANDELGLESSAKTRELASRPRL